MSSESKTKITESVSQEVFIEKLERFLKLNPEENRQLIANLQEFKQGFCFELSLSRGLMRQAKNLDWWNDTYKAILAWSGNPEHLNEALKKSFMQFAHEVLDYPPKSGAIYDILASGSKRQVTGEKAPVTLEVDRLHLMGGNFSKSSSAENGLLQEAFQNIKEMSQEGVCLIRGKRHVCELHYSNKTWSFFDSEYNPKEPLGEQVGMRVFQDHELDALFKAIVGSIGSDIGIYLVELRDLDAKKQHQTLPFQSYYDYLQNSKAKEFFCGSRMAVEMLQFAPEIFLSRYSSTTIPPVFKIAIAQSDEDSWKIAMGKGSATIDTLIKLGGDVNTPFTFNQRNTLLIDAVLNDRDDMIDFLIEKKPQLNYQNAAGDTALICAAKAGKLDVIKKLIGAGANINLINRKGQNAVMCAAANGHLEVVQYLIQHKGKLYERNHQKETTLMLAIANGHTDVAQFLLNHSEQFLKQEKYKKFISAWIANKDEDDDSAFTLALRSDDERMPKILLPYLTSKQREIYQEHLSKISSPPVSTEAEDDEGEDLVNDAKQHSKTMEGLLTQGFHAKSHSAAISKAKDSNPSLEEHQISLQVTVAPTPTSSAQDSP
ncbi:MAG TPA: ankyrin repeat domain-containing protein [Gammaproteobacteria bacterium]|nr:ankyrin repeat domain-containing protein [Gammaproteobacteria bacterium]